VTATTAQTDFDAVVVGAGFGGLAMLHRLRQHGFRTRVFEAGSGIGGTWFWNRYPGARCDIESMEYSYQFSEELQQEWEWSERYATQPEILRYIEHVADRFDLRRDIQLDTRVRSAHWNEDLGRWEIAIERGAATARFLIMATGCLSSANIPDFPGRDSFAGKTYHTGRWPHGGVDFTGQRVAVIGTGSSAIQSIPLIAEQAAHLTVFQRTASYSIPAHNAPLDPEVVRAVKTNYEGFRAFNAAQPFGASFPPNPVLAFQVDEAERQRTYEQRWQIGGLGFITAFGDLLFDHNANQTAAEFVREKIHEIVRDPAVAEKLTPKQVIGCKRLCVDTTTTPRSTARTCHWSTSRRRRSSDLRRAASASLGGVRGRRDRVRHRLRRDDRRATRRRHPRHRRPHAAREVGGGSAHLSRRRHRRASPTSSSSPDRGVPRCSRTWCPRSSSTRRGSPTASPAARARDRPHRSGSPARRTPGLPT
jgi:cation diffusion facilitator CzcD-associated flavoprotein CzcO